jgi:hypothetical protein
VRFIISPQEVASQGELVEMVRQLIVNSEARTATVTPFGTYSGFHCFGIISTKRRWHFTDIGDSGACVICGIAVLGLVFGSTYGHTMMPGDPALITPIEGQFELLEARPA